MRLRRRAASGGNSVEFGARAETWSRASDDRELRRVGPWLLRYYIVQIGDWKLETEFPSLSNETRIAPVRRDGRRREARGHAPRPLRPRGVRPASVEIPLNLDLLRRVSRRRDRREFERECRGLSGSSEHTCPTRELWLGAATPRATTTRRAPAPSLDTDALVSLCRAPTRRRRRVYSDELLRRERERERERAPARFACPLSLFFKKNRASLRASARASRSFCFNFSLF